MNLENKQILILGMPGSGKTFFATYLASFYKRVYSNYTITRRGKKVNITISSAKDLINKVKFSETKGVLILDEAGLNNNARQAMSKDNFELAKLSMLARKKNLDLIYIAQLDFSVDKYQRELSYCVFDMSSFYKGGNKLFKTRVSNYHNGKRYLRSKHVIDLIGWKNETKWNYDTTEQSLFDKV